MRKSDLVFPLPFDHYNKKFNIYNIQNFCPPIPVMCMLGFTVDLEMWNSLNLYYLPSLLISRML